MSHVPGYVLVIDDDDDVRAAIVEVLLDEGLTVFAAEHGLAGLHKLRELGPAGIILLDLMMPVMDGQTFRQEQLNDPSLAHIPVILMTAASNGGAAVKPAAVLRKPFPPEELLGLIARLRDSGRRRRHAR